MTTPPALYPSHCHGLSPTLGRWCPLRAVDVFALREVAEYEGSSSRIIIAKPGFEIRARTILDCGGEQLGGVCGWMADIT